MELNRTASMTDLDPTAPVAAPQSSEGGAAARPLADIIADLQRPIPDRLLESKRIQGQELTYCPWYRVQKILDHYTRGLWDYAIVERTLSETHLLLTVRITIHAAEGTFSREGTGIESLSVDSYGDPQSNAESQAFRRACARWGLGLHLYDE